jgi:hypothetical protein
MPVQPIKKKKKKKKKKKSHMLNSRRFARPYWWNDDNSGVPRMEQNTGLYTKSKFSTARTPKT